MNNLINEDEIYRLIHWCIGKFASHEYFKTNSEEYLSAGALAYTRALNTYNPDLGVKFSTYAIYVIKNALFSLNKEMKKYKEMNKLYLNQEFTENDNTTQIDNITYKYNNNPNEVDIMLDDMFLKDIKSYVKNIVETADRFIRINDKDNGKAFIDYFFNNYLYYKNNMSSEKEGNQLTNSQRTVAIIYDYSQTGIFYLCKYVFQELKLYLFINYKELLN